MIGGGDRDGHHHIAAAHVDLVPVGVRVGVAGRDLNAGAGFAGLRRDGDLVGAGGHRGGVMADVGLKSRVVGHVGELETGQRRRWRAGDCHVVDARGGAVGGGDRCGDSGGVLEVDLVAVGAGVGVFGRDHHGGGGVVGGRGDGDPRGADNRCGGIAGGAGLERLFEGRVGDVQSGQRRQRHAIDVDGVRDGVGGGAGEHGDGVGADVEADLVAGRVGVGVVGRDRGRSVGMVRVGVDGGRVGL